jgi:hypothetical protein
MFFTYLIKCTELKPDLSIYNKEYIT